MNADRRAAIELELRTLPSYSSLDFLTREIPAIEVLRRLDDAPPSALFEVEEALVRTRERNDLRELEQAEPWTASWSARYGAGDAKLRAWIAAGRPRADRAALSVIGDGAIVTATRRVVARLPESVAQYLVGNAVVVCAGLALRGFCGPLPLPPCEAPHLVALATADEGIIAHEFAHAWHRTELPGPRLTAQQLVSLRVAVTEHASERGDVDDLIEHRLQSEAAGDELARAWGFDVDTTSGHHGERRRRGLMREVEQDLAAAEKA